MRLSDRYVFGELLLPFMIGTLAVLMMLVGNTLFALLETMLRQKWPASAVARVLVLNIPVVLVYTLPVATALAASLATNRMARDNEITVLRGSGTALARAFAPILLFGALVSVGTFLLSERVVPWAWREQQNVQSFLDNLPKSPIEAGFTIRVENYTITFNSAQKISDTKRRLNKVQLVEAAQQPGEYPILTLAETADYESGVWTLKNATVHRFNADGTLLLNAQVRDVTLNQRIDFSQAYTPLQGDQLRQVSFAELSRRAGEARRLGQTANALTYEVERWFKLSLPAMCFVFALCAPPLALRFSRAGSFTGVLLSIIVVFVAWNTLLLMKYVGLGGLVPPLMAAWTTNALFTLLGLWLLRAQE